MIGNPKAVSSGGKLWAGETEDMDQDEWEDQDQAQGDPRKDEEWKIQKRKGFLKDKASKADNPKLSKTARRNSKESMFKDSVGMTKGTESTSNENTFDSLIAKLEL